MVGEPTTYTHAWFDAFGTDVVDATPLLERARAVKTAGDRAHAARQRDRRRGDGARPRAPAAGDDGERGAALWNGFVHGEGTGWGGEVDLAHGFSLVWSGPGIRTFTATGDRPVQEHEPTLFEIWVCADGYWCDHTKNLVPVP